LIAATVALGLSWFPASFEPALAQGGLVSCSVTDVPVRLAIKVLWSSGAPQGSAYEVSPDVPEETRVTLSLENVPFEAALDAFCRAAGLKFEVRDNRYLFSRSDRRASSISIVRSGDRVSWKLRDADPLEVLLQLLEAFGKKAELKLDQDPSAELQEQARRYAQELQQAQQAPPAEQANRIREIQRDAERFLKPPKRLPAGSSRSISIEQTQVPFSEALDVLGNAGGFLWFRGQDGRILVRDTASPDVIRSIFQREGVWDALQRR